MGSVWTFIRKPNNQRLLSWVGGGGAVAAAGIWAVVTYGPLMSPPRTVRAQQGSVAAGRDASGINICHNNRDRAQALLAERGPH